MCLLINSDVLATFTALFQHLLSLILFPSWVVGLLFHTRHWLRTKDGGSVCS
uniref:Uncharacterized protein n=1 Tax=Rhizophora mucronata TaxID=61149 RepID=A0A2P2N3Q7_RHIMU